MSFRSANDDRSFARDPRCYDRSVRLVPLFAIALSSCALFTNFGAFSSSDDERDAGSPDGPAGSDLEAGSTDAPSPFDANVLGLPPNTIFADSFDDATPIPRGWDLSLGSPKITTGEVISPPHILTSTSVRTTPSVAALVKTIALSQKTSVSCSFKVKLQSFASVSDVHVTAARMIVPGFTYISFHLTPYQWQSYGQFADGGEHGDRHVRQITKLWMSTKLTIAASGAVSVIVDDIVKTQQLPITGELPSVRFEIGLGEPLEDRDADVHYDDVVCTAE